MTVTAERGDDSWRLTVTDDGSGIPETRRSAVFEPYQRATPGSTESVGLGLTASRRLARLMDGDLKHEHDGERSTFSLSLPAA